MKTFIYFFLILLLTVNITAQDSPTLPPLPQSSQQSSEVISDAHPNSRSFIWSNISVNAGAINKHFLNSCAVTLVGITNFFPGGSVFAGATLYTVNLNAPYQLYTVDTAFGIHTLVANVTNVPLSSLTGLAWDHTTNTMYASATNVSLSQIGTINLSTGVMTPIGTPSAVAAGVVAIAISPDGTLFAVGIVAANLYRFNKTTGVATLVGPLGVNPGPQTDIQFDMRDSMAYTINNNELRMSATPGGGTLVCTFNQTYSAFAIRQPLTTTGIASTGIIPSNYFLEQNYPNPFNPTTKIKFGLPKSSNVKLTIYDVLGREVQVLVNELIQANTYEVDFDGSHLPSGVYFYKLETSDFTTTKKMLMIK